MIQHLLLEKIMEEWEPLLGDTLRGFFAKYTSRRTWFNLAKQAMKPDSSAVFPGWKLPAGYILPDGTPSWKDVSSAEIDRISENRRQEAKRRREADQSGETVGAGEASHSAENRRRMIAYFDGVQAGEASRSAENRRLETDQSNNTVQTGEASGSAENRRLKTDQSEDAVSAAKKSSMVKHTGNELADITNSSFVVRRRPSLKKSVSFGKYSGEMMAQQMAESSSNQTALMMTVDQHLEMMKDFVKEQLDETIAKRQVQAFIDKVTAAQMEDVQTRNDKIIEKNVITAQAHIDKEAHAKLAQTKMELAQKERELEEHKKRIKEQERELNKQTRTPKRNSTHPRERHGLPPKPTLPKFGESGFSYQQLAPTTALAPYQGGFSRQPAPTTALAPYQDGFNQQPSFGQAPFNFQNQPQRFGGTGYYGFGGSQMAPQDPRFTVPINHGFGGSQIAFQDARFTGPTNPGLGGSRMGTPMGTPIRQPRGPPFSQTEITPPHMVPQIGQLQTTPEHMGPPQMGPQNPRFGGPMNSGFGGPENRGFGGQQIGNQMAAPICQPMGPPSGQVQIMPPQIGLQTGPMQTTPPYMGLPQMGEPQMGPRNPRFGGPVNRGFGGQQIDNQMGTPIRPPMGPPFSQTQITPPHMNPQIGQLRTTSQYMGPPQMGLQDPRFSGPVNRDFGGQQMGTPIGTPMRQLMGHPTAQIQTTPPHMGPPPMELQDARFNGPVNYGFGAPQMGTSMQQYMPTPQMMGPPQLMAAQQMGTPQMIGPAQTGPAQPPFDHQNTRFIEQGNDFHDHDFDDVDNHQLGLPINLPQMHLEMNAPQMHHQLNPPHVGAPQFVREDLQVAGHGNQEFGNNQMGPPMRLQMNPTPHMPHIQFGNQNARTTGYGNRRNRVLSIDQIVPPTGAPNDDPSFLEAEDTRVAGHNHHHHLDQGIDNSPPPRMGPAHTANPSIAPDSTISSARPEETPSSSHRQGRSSHRGVRGFTDNSGQSASPEETRSSGRAESRIHGQMMAASPFDHRRVSPTYSVRRGRTRTSPDDAHISSHQEELGADPFNDRTTSGLGSGRAGNVSVSPRDVRISSARLQYPNFGAIGTRLPPPEFKFPDPGFRAASPVARFPTHPRPSGHPGRPRVTEGHFSPFDL